MPATVTVVMITRDRRDAALHAVAQLQRLPELCEIIVVDNGSSDGTAGVLRDQPGVTVIDGGSNLGSAGRTAGVAAAKTDYVAFSDDDSWWAPGALATAAGLFDASPRLGLLTGRTLVGPEQQDDPINAMLAAAPLGRQPGLPGPTVLGFLACAAVVRRDAYLKAGGFHPRYGVGAEEQLLALDLLAAGWELCYVPDLIAHHYPRTTHVRSGRGITQTRNDLWTTWLRRPLPVVARHTAAVARSAARDRESRAAVGQALRGLPWVFRQRRVLPPEVEKLRQRLD